MEPAERGWAGNKGQMGRVGETTASSHQHRCRYRIIVVCYRAFGENDRRYAKPFNPRQPMRLQRKRSEKEREKMRKMLVKLKGKNDKR